MNVERLCRVGRFGMESTRIKTVIRFLKERNRTTMMFVTLAEMARAITDLKSVEMEMQAMIVNQMLAEKATTSGLFGSQRARQLEYLRQLAKRHSDRILAEYKLFDDEVIGIMALRQAGGQIITSATATIRG